jgi:hypothetical protein
VSDPFSAPVGSVLVYGTARSVGHVELRTRDGFVSDFRSKTPSRRPLLGVYAKLSVSRGLLVLGEAIHSFSYLITGRMVLREIRAEQFGAS